MLRFVTKSKKGFTMVELLIVLLLLSLGAFALINMFSVANRSFNKSEERYLKQEAVKMAAELLRTGSANVAPAQTADVFKDTSVVPTGEAIDEAYSYLFTQPVKKCKECDANVLYTANACSTSGCSGTLEFAGYYLYNQNMGEKRAAADRISDEPMYVSIRPYETPSYEGGLAENQCGVTITIAALEEDFEYEFDSNGILTKQPTADDIYYSLDVAYHFPNMVTNASGVTVNYVSANQLSAANKYDSNGNIVGSEYAVDCYSSVDSNGKPRYYACSQTLDGKEHCGCDTNLDKHEDSIYCKDCDCSCPNKIGSVLRVYADSIISGDNTNTSVAIPKLCFIASASYGHDSGEVGMLCDFRDKCLLTNPLGKAFVNAYYTISPPIADFIRESEPLKAAVRIALKPLVVAAEYSLNPDIRAEGVISLVMVFGCGIGATVTMMKIDKRFRKEKRKEK